MSMREILSSAAILLLIIVVPVCVYIAKVSGVVTGYIIMSISILLSIFAFVGMFFLVRAIYRWLGF